MWQDRVRSSSTHVEEGNDSCDDLHASLSNVSESTRTPTVSWRDRSRENNGSKKARSRPLLWWHVINSPSWNLCRSSSSILNNRKAWARLAATGRPGEIWPGNITLSFIFLCRVFTGGRFKSLCVRAAKALEKSCGWCREVCKEARRINEILTPMLTQNFVLALWEAKLCCKTMDSRRCGSSLTGIQF